MIKKNVLRIVLKNKKILLQLRHNKKILFFQINGVFWGGGQY